MKIHSSKIVLLLSLIVILLSFGCAQKTEDKPITEEKTITEDKPITTETSTNDSPTNIDTSSWKQESSIKGITFAYPEEYTYQGGGDIDTGSSSFIADAQNQLVFKIFTSSLVKCQFDDPALCNLGTLIPATPREVFDILLQDMPQNEFYSVSGDMQVGNVQGKSFLLKEQKNDGSSTTKVIFYGSEGVYTVENFLKDANGDALFRAFLSTFKVSQ